MVTDRLRFLLDDHGFTGPETEPPWDRIPAIARVRYHRKGMTIEVTHVVGFMGENYVETRCRHPDEDGNGDWLALGHNTTHTGYQLQRAIDLQARAVSSHLGTAKAGGRHTG